MTYYVANPGPGQDAGGFPFGTKTWLWWIAGGAHGALIDYQAYSNDDRYVNQTRSSFLASQGPAFDLNTRDSSEANDDQAFWVFAALAALEQDFPQLPCPASKPACGNSWLLLADNAFNDFVQRWESNKVSCGGGLTWSFQFNPGMPGQSTYKNSVSNGGFFQIAARLARYTGDDKYATWAETVYDWMSGIGFVGSGFQVYDGAGIDQACKQLNTDQWSYNSAIMMYGAAAMADFYGGSNVTWNQRVDGFVSAALAQFTTPSASGPILIETVRNCAKAGPNRQSSSCATPMTEDQKTFKGYLARFMGKTAAIYPAASAKIMPVLRASAIGAAKTCSGGASGTMCSHAWYSDFDPSQTGMQEQLIALEVFNSLQSAAHKPLKAH